MLTLIVQEHDPQVGSLVGLLALSRRWVQRCEAVLPWWCLQVAKFLRDCNVPPYYALSWVITWFSHDVHDLGSAARLFDLFLVSTPLMPLYVSAALLVSHKESLLSCSPDCDQAEVHHFLNKLDLFSGTSTPDVIFVALHLHKQFPPRELIRAFSSQSSSGVLVRRPGHGPLTGSLFKNLDLRRLLGVPVLPRWMLKPIGNRIIIKMAVERDSRNPFQITDGAIGMASESEVARYERRGDQVPRECVMEGDNIDPGQRSGVLQEQREKHNRFWLAAAAPTATLLVGAISVAWTAASGERIGNLLEGLAAGLGLM
eukprot:scaffold324_cov394-Prasinococcus_capsulatus_cf.AAC.21